jgi:hypothetical protein
MKKDFLLMTGALLVLAENVLACKCAIQTQEFRYSAKNSPLIFYGQLVSVIDEEKSGAAGTYLIRIYKFVPCKIWRGTKADTITLVSGNNNCDVALERGRYVIYTNPTRDLTSCNRTRGGTTEAIESEVRKLDRIFTRRRFKKLQAAE